MSRIFWPISVSAIMSIGAGWLMIRLGPRWGWIDRPDDPDLKSHRQAAVPLGGVAIWLATNLAALVAGFQDLGLAAASTILLVLGLLDDRRSLSPQVRLAVEAGAGLALGAGRPDGFIGTLIVALLVVIGVNAVNLFDGLDGLAGLSGLVSALGIAALALIRGFDPSFGFAIAAALGGFLLWNWHPARLFLGDNGAYVVAVILVAGIDRAGPTTASLLIGAGLLGVFLIDMGATVLRRILVSQPMFSRDRLHLYDRLADRGVPVSRVALTSAVLQVVVAGAVVAADRWLPPGAAIISLAIFGATLVVGLVRALGATRPGFWTGQ